MDIEFIVGDRAAGKTTRLKERMSSWDREDVLVVVHTREAGKLQFKGFDITTPNSSSIRGKRYRLVCFDNAEWIQVQKDRCLKDYLTQEILPILPESLVFTCSYEAFGRLRSIFSELQDFTGIIYTFLDVLDGHRNECPEMFQKDPITGKWMRKPQWP